MTLGSRPIESHQTTNRCHHYHLWSELWTHFQERGNCCGKLLRRDSSVAVIWGAVEEIPSWTFFKISCDCTTSSRLEMTSLQLVGNSTDFVSIQKLLIGILAILKTVPGCSPRNLPRLPSSESPHQQHFRIVKHHNHSQRRNSYDELHSTSTKDCCQSGKSKSLFASNFVTARNSSNIYSDKNAYCFNGNSNLPFHRSSMDASFFVADIRGRPRTKINRKVPQIIRWSINQWRRLWPSVRKQVLYWQSFRRLWTRWRHKMIHSS